MDGSESKSKMVSGGAMVEEVSQPVLWTFPKTLSHAIAGTQAYLKLSGECAGSPKYLVAAGSNVARIVQSSYLRRVNIQALLCDNSRHSFHSFFSLGIRLHIVEMP